MNFLKRLLVLMMAASLVILGGCVTQEDVDAAYQRGKEAGIEAATDTRGTYDDGYQAGHDKGYEEGSKAGYDEGYSDGYDDAEEEYSSSTSDSSEASESASVQTYAAGGSTSSSSESTGTTVYITDTGKKYHRDGCQYLRESKHSISLSSAKEAGYGPCSRCHPPY